MPFEIRVNSINFESEEIQKYHEADLTVIQKVYAELEKRYLKTAHKFNSLEEASRDISQINEDLALEKESYFLVLDRIWTTYKESKKIEDDLIVNFPICLDSLDIELHGRGWAAPDGMTADEAQERWDWLVDKPLTMAGLYLALE